jgi:MarR family 2-MHQ and catechol resistance regulon transcriptional repressor
MKQKRTRPAEDSSGIHLWLILMKSFQALAGHAEGSIKQTGLGDSDFRVLEALLHKGPLPVNTVGPMVWLTPGSISVAVDRLVRKGLVSRKGRAGDRRVRQVELTSKGRALIKRGFGVHAAAMENIIGVLSGNERLTLLRLLKKLGKHAAETAIGNGVSAPKTKRGDRAPRLEESVIPGRKKLADPRS